MFCFLKRERERERERAREREREREKEREREADRHKYRHADRVKETKINARYVVFSALCHAGNNWRMRI